MSVLWTESLGKMMIGFGMVSMFIGSLIIKKIVSFKG
jgi:Flp pilus assembly protein TadB